MIKRFPGLVLIFWLSLEAMDLAAQTISFIVQDASCMGGTNGTAEVVLNSYPQPYYYSWSNGQVTSQSTGLAAGNYTVTVTYGPSSTDTTLSVLIKELTCPIFPGWDFTPNNDNYNEVWAVDNIQFYPDFLLFVYNRWGQKVYEQKGNYTPWDGILNGVPLPSASYYYVIIPDGKEKHSGVLKGSVTLIR